MFSGPIYQKPIVSKSCSVGDLGRRKVNHYVQDRAVANERAEQVRKAAEEGAIVDPDLFGRGLARGMLRGGRPKGSLRAYKNHKLVEAPLLHRDPSAPDRLLSCER